MLDISKRILLTLDITWFLAVAFGFLALIFVSTTPDRGEYERFTEADIERSEYLQANNINSGDYIEITQNWPKKEYGSIVRAEDMPLFHISSLRRQIWDEEFVYSVLGLLGYMLARWIILGTAIPLGSTSKSTSPTS